MIKVTSHFTFFLLFIILCQTGNSQKSTFIDSLLVLSEKEQNDSLKAGLYFELAKAYVTDDLVKSSYYSDLCIEQCDKINCLTIKAKALHVKSIISFYKAEPFKALEEVWQSFDCAKQVSDFQEMGYAKLLEGVIMSDYFLTEEAIKLYNESYKYYSKVNDSSGFSKVFNNLGVAFWNLGKYDSALVYYKKAVLHSVNYGDDSYALNNMGNIYLKKGMYDSALYYLNQSLLQKENEGNLVDLSTIYSSYAEYYYKIGDYDKSLQYWKKSEKYARQSNILQEIEYAVEGLSKVYSMKKDFEKAYNYLLEYKEFHDTLFQQEFTSLISREKLRLQYEKEQEEREFEVKKQQRKDDLTKIYLLFFLALTTIFVFTFFINYRLKVKDNNLLREQQTKIHNQNIKLNELMKSNSSLVGFLVHDLKTPISNIKSIVELLSTSGTYNDEQNELFGLLNSATLNAEQLIEDLVYLKNIEQGGIKTKISELNLNQLVQEAKSNFDKTASKKDIKVHYIPFEELNYSIVSDERLITRIINNIISNAIKFSPSGKNVWISLTKSEHEYIFSCKDEGPGIDADDKQKLFQKFARLKARPTANEHSSGLGLAIVLDLLHMLDGRIEVVSDPGAGSEFIIYLKSLRSSRFF
ncbi:MAG: tetratricopeptide repeat-containing sensor histidine kinase [Bacteroidales bacterium]|nr:tetratricopeptide repeat-containing sensor histidine kinase [Bacteroidales bacterium]MBN2821283.1 tetratricopeptide repeat-containing sensor histidine kinase [Bacteroidales bacterium]